MEVKDLFRKKTIDAILKESDLQPSHLNRTLSVFDLTGFGIAAIVGAGIFSTIGNAVVHGGPAVVFLFLFTAVSCGFSALCYAHFVSRVPVSGSAYTYAYVSFGELIAWIVGWDLFMEYAVSNVAVAISWSEYLGSFMRGFHVVVPSQFIILGSTYHIDFPAFVITILITIICYVGIKESKNFSNVLVLVKIGVILTVILVGAFYVQPTNWVPFAPNGLGGVFYGISSVFFAYIGFDAISTTAEECKNPQKELPLAMFWSLGISTVMYIAITLTLTGMVKYSSLGVGDPLSFVFEKVGLNFLSGMISFISILTLSSVLLVYQLGQPRIWMSMSRDGLLPKIFSKVHPKFKTPSFSTLLMGIVVGVPALFANLKDVIDLTSIGTLFAFALVCGGVIVQELREVPYTSGFKIFYINSRYFLPPIVVVVLSILIINMTDFKHHHEKIPVYVFYVLFLVISALAVYKGLSLIPVLGLMSNLYLMAEMGLTNWLRFLIWLALGLVVYFVYSRKNSKLNV